MTPSPNLEQRAMDLLAAKAALASELVDLDAQPVSAMLDPSALRGTTKQEVLRIRQVHDAIWDAFRSVGAVTDEIEALRLKNSRLDQRNAELILLFEKPVSGTSTAEAVVHEARKLLDSYKATVGKIEDAWRVLIPRASSVEQRAASLRPLADELGDSQAEVTRLAQRAKEYTESLGADPLGADTTALSSLADNVERVARSLNELRRTRDELPQDLDRARADVDALRSVIAAGIAAAQRSRTRVVLTRPLPDPLSLNVVDGPKGLRERLAALSASAEEARAASAEPNAKETWRRDARDLAAIRSELTLTAQNANEIVAAHRAVITERDRLRGRFDAYRAKAAAEGRSEEARLVELQTAAHKLLHDGPVDLAAAEAAVSAYGAQLSAQATAQSQPGSKARTPT